MKTKVFTLLLLLCISLQAGAQGDWFQISSPGKELIVTSELTGYRFFNESVGSHGSKYTLQKSTDGCRNFTTILTKTGDFGCYSLDEMYFISPEVGFIGEMCQGLINILKTTDGGASWTQTSMGATYGLSMFFLNEETGYYSFCPGPPNASYFLRNGTLMYSSTRYILSKDSYYFPNTTTRIKFTNDSTGYISCSDSLGNAVILKTTNWGTDWSEQVLLPGEYFKDLIFVNDSTGIVVGSNGLILRTADAGEVWSTVNSNVNFSLNAIDLSPDGRIYIAGNGGTVLHSDDLGATWTPVDFPYGSNLIYIKAFADQCLYVNDSDGKLYTNTSPLGINNHRPGSVHIYPNPADAKIKVNLTEKMHHYVIKISDANGTSNIVTSHNEVDISKLPAGIYFLTLETDTEIWRGKFIKL